MGYKRSSAILFRSGNTPFFPNSNAKNGIEKLSVKGLDTFNSTYGNAYKVSLKYQRGMPKNWISVQKRKSCECNRLATHSFRCDDSTI